MKPSYEIDKLADCFSFPAELNQVDAAFDHLLGDMVTILRFSDVAEINYTVEIAIVECSQIVIRADGSAATLAQACLTTLRAQ